MMSLVVIGVAFSCSPKSVQAQISEYEDTSVQTLFCKT